MGIEIEVAGGYVECSVGAKIVWSVSIADIVLLAEYNTRQGYWGDDSYLVLMSVENGEPIYRKIPDIAIGGLVTILRALQPHFDTNLELQLPWSEWNSRVIWPEAIRDERLFTLDPIAPVGIWEKARARFMGKQLSLALAPAVQGYLQHYDASATT